MKMIVESLLGANAHVLDNPNANFAIISITLSDILFNKQMKHPHLIIVKEDLDETFPLNVIEDFGGLFDKHDANKVKEFVEEHINKVDYFLIHCDAGVSRSRGVAAALGFVFNNDGREHFDNGLPNPVIFKEVLAAFGMKKDYPERQPSFCMWCGERITGTFGWRENELIHIECASAYDYKKAEFIK